MIAMNSYPASSVVPILFSTYAGATGASVTLTGLAVTDIEIYKGTSMTQRASDAGYALLDTDGIDIDGITGIHGFSIDLGDNTDAGFYAVGSFYHVVVSAVTVDSQVVNFIADRFRIVAAEAVAGKPKVDVDAWLGTAAATPTVAGVPEVDVTHLGGAAQSATDLKDFADEGYDPATNKVQGVVLVDTLTTYTGNTVQTGDSFARLGAPAGASISADIAAIEAQTDDIGAAGAGLTAIPWNAAWDAEVQSEVQDALEANNLDHVAGTGTGIPAIPAGTYLDQMMDDGTAVYDRTTDSLQALRDNIGAAGAGLTAIDLPDQTMNITGNITGNLSGSVGSVTGAVGSVTGAVGSVTGAVGSVTGNVGGNVNGSVGSVAAGGIAAASFAAGAITATVIATNAIDADALAADAVTEIQAGLSTLTTAEVNAEVVDALATDTYAEPGQGAPAATTTLAAKINYLYKAFRNKITQTSTTYSLFDDAGTTVDQKSTVSDDGTTLTRGEIVSGP